MITALSRHIPFFVILIFGYTASVAQSNYKYSISLSSHYGNNFLSETPEEEFSGRIGYGFAFQYFIGKENKKIKTSIGLAYSRIGRSRNFLWEDATPEREQLYGKFPIHYEVWNDVHYLSIPLNFKYYLSETWFIGSSFSLDYPLGSSYFNERISDDGAVIETNKDGYNAGKVYPWNTSVGLGVQIGKIFNIGSTVMFIEGNFKTYALLAARKNDYFPHEDYERPYTLGINVGMFLGSR
jgi:hypothetical protein